MRLWSRGVAALIIAAVNGGGAGCSSSEIVRVVDLRADFRDIWKGREQPETGKETSPEGRVSIEFSVPLKADLRVGDYIPVSADARCKGTIPAVRDESPSAGQAPPTVLSLLASRPLVGGCSYRFSIPAAVRVSSHGGRLATPLTVTFRVAKWNGSPALRELAQTSHDLSTRTLTMFMTRPGINAPVDEALIRYQDEIGIPGSDLRPSGDWKPSFVSRTEVQKQYVQCAHGYEVSGHGYLVLAENGMFRSALGHVLPGVPAMAPPQLTAAVALQKALDHLGLAPPPWVTNPAVVHAPVGRLRIERGRRAQSRDFALAWYFALGDEGGLMVRGVSVEAHSGEVLDVDSVSLVE